MPVLFSALLPPDDVVEAVAEALGDPDDGLRWEQPERWHVTLAFYGQDDPGWIVESDCHVPSSRAREVPSPRRPTADVDNSLPLRMTSPRIP